MTANPAAFSRVLARTARRLRVQRGLRYALVGCTASALTVTGWLLAARLAWLDHAPAGAPSLVAGCSLLAFALGGARPLSRSGIADALDRAGALRGRVRAAFAFEELPLAQRTAFMNAAICDGRARGALVSPARAAPYVWPSFSWPAAAALLACSLVAWWPAREGAPLRDAKAPARVFVHGLERDDLVAFRSALAALAERPELADVRRAYAQLLAQLAAGQLAPDAAIAQLIALESKLASRRAGTAGADDRSLSALARELAVASAEVGRALPSQPEQAARELRKLGAGLHAGTMDERERAQLARALEAARVRERERARSEAREQELESLLASHSSGPAGARPEPSLLQRARRELEQLRRNAAERRAEHRELSRLSRELASAREALAGGRERDAGSALERAADALDRFSGGRDSEAQRRALERELSQLRQLLSQRAATDGSPPTREPAGRQQREPSQEQGSQGEQQARERTHSERLRRERFDARARGLADAGSKVALRLREGSGRTGEGARDDGARADGGGSPLTLRRGEVSVPGELTADGDGEQVELADAPAQAGDGHDETRATPSPKGRVDYDDEKLRGVRGRGPSRSQVIAGAAEAGFARAPYRKVFSDYRAHAEELIAQDEIPAGYRFHVRRYFQLVRPREPEEAP